MKSLSCVQFFATLWTVAYQASPSMGISRQECWSGLPFPSPEDLPDPGIEPEPSAVKAQSPNYWTAREFPKITLKSNTGQLANLEYAQDTRE